MTVSSTTVKNSYSGNGSTTQFAYGYKIFADSDLIVIIRTDSTGVETVKTLTTHYTVAGAGDASGGSITFTSGNTPASGETVVIIREVPQTQAIDYIANDPFPAESHEEGLDRATMTTQQVQEELNRSLKISRTNTMTSTEFTTSAADRANKVLAFNASGEIAVTQELGTFKGDSATTTTAAFVARDIVKATTTAQLNNIYICVADSVIGDLLTDTDHFALLVDAVSAATSATASATSATASASSATASASSASTASTQASNAASSATASANSATAAASSATDAAASADAFDDIYLGSKSSDPSTDNDGDALAAGMLYFNTTNDILRVYSGSAWQDAALSSTGFVTLTGTQTLTNKTLTAPVINSPTGDFIKIAGTNFTRGLLVGHATTGTLNGAEDNTGVGINALDALTSGDSNTAVGTRALSSNTIAGNNTAVGTDSQPSVSVGTKNSTLGSRSMASSLSGDNNVAIGYKSLEDSTADNNTAIGSEAGKEISNSSYNIALGYQAGDNITTGSGNVIIGSVDAAAADSARTLKISGYDGSSTTNWISGTSAGAITFNGAYTFPTADGSASQVLQTNGSGALSFATSSSGKVLQVVHNNHATRFVTSSTSYVAATGYTVVITPSATSSKIFLVMTGQMDTEAAGRIAYGTIYRTISGGSPAAVVGDAEGITQVFNPDARTQAPMTLTTLDSPNTTSAITYQIYVKSNTGQVSFNNNEGDAQLTAFEIAG